MGAPGTGKTTLACSMKEYVLTKGFSSDVCTEYPREFCLIHGVPSSPYAQYKITLKQWDREKVLLSGINDYVFTDSPVFLGYIFCLLNMKADASYEFQSILPDFSPQ